MLGLIWVQIICKGYQQTTPAGNELKQLSVFKMPDPQYVFQNLFSEPQSWLNVKKIPG